MFGAVHTLPEQSFMFRDSYRPLCTVLYREEMRLTADADPARWAPVTDTSGRNGRRLRKAATRAMLAQVVADGTASPRATRLSAWLISRTAPTLIRRADGRVLVWIWKDNPEALTVLASTQPITPQARAARAMLPMEYDDTEEFRSPYLGVGEKLVLPHPPQPHTPPGVSYRWETFTHFVTLQAVYPDPERFGIAMDALDDLARTLRTLDDVPLGDDATVLRIDPA